MMLIVVPPKGIDLLLRIFERREPMHVQAFFAEPPVERFDSGVVRRLAATAEVEDDAVRIRTQIHRRTDELGPVVAVDALWQSPLEAESLERGDDIATTQALTDVDGQAFTRE